MKKFLRHLLNRVGYDIVKVRHFGEVEKNAEYEFNKEAFEAIKVIKDYTMVPYQNLEQLFEMVKYCEERRIAGDYVECGVWKGGSIGLMALANLQYSSIRRNLHLFDIFADIGEPDPTKDGVKALKDVEKYLGKKLQLTGKKESMNGFYDSFGGHGTLQGNQELLENIIGYPRDSIQYHVGWFQDTIPNDYSEMGPIAILRLDGDWYESTWICLNHLFDKVVKGGFVIIDDYGTYEGCSRAVNEFFAERNIHPFLSYSSTECRYWIRE